MLGLGVSNAHFVGRKLCNQNPAQAGPNYKAASPRPCTFGMSAVTAAA